MPREDLVQCWGTIEKSCGGGQYSIALEDSSQIITAKVCGKMKQNHIRVMPGDRVEVSVSPYDLSHGIITRRPSLKKF